ncbi:OFA family MFS transporter [Aureimonas sp. ME7]|uniref:OFA family MFS transporter n=1 Tax=Aureimonas sp. ME7 TaxID=2744252 RepID=UPI0015F58A1A|nr:OFA family MFS transporter [Aureimonas sp. ME7]
MSSAADVARPAGVGFLDRENTVAKAGFNRWLIPPCALAIHLCIGMAYGFSVFWLPLSRAIGISQPVACEGMTLATALFTTTCDWRVSDLLWMYTLFFVVLGTAAAIWGGWLERAGPRKAGLVAALCWCGGMVISAIGIYTHQLWLMWLGSGVIGGIGLGLGYISPVSTLIKWFPDRRGMATGMAIMGFGGGAMIGSPLADILMRRFASADGVGVWQTFLVLAAGYFVFMVAGALGYRVPPENWRPAGWTPAAGGTKMIATGDVHLKDAHKTPQFWLIWVVLLVNVTASIGLIGVASPMLQEIFGGRLIGAAGTGFLDFTPEQRTAAAAVGAGFVGLVSLFNIGGRFFWASFSDRLGRKVLYATILALGLVLYAAVVPFSASSGSVFLFVAAFCIIASMYGGGFATVPAYLADVFGTKFVGAIHGRLLTAWSLAGVFGGLITGTIRDNNIASGVPRDQVYQPIFFTVAALLAVGFVANLLVRPVAQKWQMREAAKGAAPVGTAPATVAAAAPAPAFGDYGIGRGGFTGPAILAWVVVGLPLLWGVFITLQKAAALF